MLVFILCPLLLSRSPTDCLVAFKFNGCPKKQATQFFISHVATLSASCAVGHDSCHSPRTPLVERECVAHQLLVPRYNINCAWRIKNQRQRPLKCHYTFIRYDAISWMPPACASLFSSDCVCVYVCVCVTGLKFYNYAGCARRYNRTFALSYLDSC